MVCAVCLSIFFWVDTRYARNDLVPWNQAVKCHPGDCGGISSLMKSNMEYICMP